MSCLPFISKKERKYIKLIKRLDRVKMQLEQRAFNTESFVCKYLKAISEKRDDQELNRLYEKAKNANSSVPILHNNSGEGD